MMIEQTVVAAKAVWKVVKNERVYELHIATDTPLGEMHDVLLEMKGETLARLTANQNSELAQAQAFNEAGEKIKQQELEDQKAEALEELQAAEVPEVPEVPTD